MPPEPIAHLRRLLRAGNHNDVQQMIRDRDYAIAEWNAVFSDPENLDDDDLTRFLQFEHNRHWWGLHTRTSSLVGSIGVVRVMVRELLDADTPISERIDGLGHHPDFDHDVWSPILLVTHPDRYGVWNGISETAMRRLGLWPEVEDGASTGELYVTMNEILTLVRDELDTDLWTLDALWWAVEKEHDPSRHFVTRRRPAPPARSRPSSAGRTRTPVKESVETFVCPSCWTTKPVRLRSGDTCIDCG